MGILNQAGQSNGTSKPFGMTHQTRDFASLKIPHWIIHAQQEAYPELATQMKNNPINATNIYAAFVLIVSLQVKGALTDEVKLNILKHYGVVK